MDSDAMVDEVQDLVGRPDGDSVLIVDARVNRWLNEAQDYIVEKCPGILDTETEDTSLTCVSDQIDYSMGSFDPTACHPNEVWYWNGDESKRLTFMPRDDFDDDYPDPTSSDFSPAKPKAWTQIGRHTLRIAPRPSSDYAGDTLRVVYTGYPNDITGSDTSALTNADQGLVYYATSMAWKAIGRNTEAMLYWKRFTNPYPNNLGWLEEYQAYQANMPAYDEHLFGEL